MCERHVVPQYMDHCEVPMSFNSSLRFHHHIFTPPCPLWQAATRMWCYAFMSALTATKI